MIRTQVQLTEEQVQSLRGLAASENVSVAELIRKAVDYWLYTASPVSEERRRRALAIVGQFESGKSDISERHDEYLAEAYDE